jgi:hypothetical protein
VPLKWENYYPKNRKSIIIIKIVYINKKEPLLLFIIISKSKIIKN